MEVGNLVFVCKNNRCGGRNGLSPLTYGVADGAAAPAASFDEDTHHFNPLAPHQLKVLKQLECKNSKKNRKNKTKKKKDILRHLAKCVRMGRARV